MGSGVLLLLAAIPSQTDFDSNYFLTNSLPISLKGNLTNWSSLNTNTMVAKAGDTMTGRLNLPGMTSTANSTNNAQMYIDQLIVPSLRLRRYVLTHAGTVTLDWSTNTVQKIVLTGDVTFVCSNLDTNRTYDLIIANSQATNCAITWPTNIVNAAIGLNNFFGYSPTYISAGKHGWFQGQVGCQTNWLIHAAYAETQ